MANDALAKAREKGDDGPGNIDDDGTERDEVVEVDPDAEPDEAEAKDGEPKAPKAQRRAERGRGFRQELEEKLEEQRRQFEGQIQALTQRPIIVQQQAPSQPNDGKLPEDIEIDRLNREWYRDMKDFEARWAGKQIPPEEEERALQKSQKYQNDLSLAQHKRNIRLVGGPRVPTEADMRAMAVRAPILDLLEHPDASIREEFQAEYWHRVKALKKPDTNATLYATADDIRRKYGMVPESGPASRHQRAKYEGRSRGASAQEGGKVQFQITPQIRQSAIAAFPGMEEGAAVRKWCENKAKRDRASGKNGRA
jgi:hypothetical protein